MKYLSHKFVFKITITRDCDGFRFENLGDEDTNFNFWLSLKKIIADFPAQQFYIESPVC